MLSNASLPTPYIATELRSAGIGETLVFVSGCVLQPVGVCLTSGGSALPCGPVRLREIALRDALQRKVGTICHRSPGGKRKFEARLSLSGMRRAFGVARRPPTE
jgi:hypothetical protein